MALIIGDMRYLVTIRQLISTKDEYGSSAESYSDLMTIRAGVKFISGTKSIDSKEIFTSQVVQFTTHYRPAITATMRIIYEGKLYRILSISPVGFNEGLTINTELINE